MEKRYDIEKFNEITNFGLWQVRMVTILVQSILKRSLQGKSWRMQTKQSRGSLMRRNL
ncbi:hypothetical protein Golax_019774, partial [Gossypium laxum]|nr:hypothetical protein [Gossypium laxum]